jgi:hypothetical protein
MRAVSSIDDVVGVWRITKYEVVGDEKARGTNDVDGRLVYDASGAMIVLVVWRRDDGSPGTIAYSGRFRVEAGEVIHDVDIAAHPREPRIRRRSARIDGSTLTLVAELGAKGTHTLVWRRERFE